MDTRARPSIGHTFFDTPLGRCGIAWSARGITRIELPESLGEPAAPRPDAGERAGADPPPCALDAIPRITLHLSGIPQDFRSIAIDMTGLPPFFQRVYEAARAIQPGHTVSYAEMAALAGSPKAFRAVGQALAKNPFCPVVPCHRVLAAGGKPGGFSGPGGLATKMLLLDLEGRPRPPAQAALAW